MDAALGACPHTVMGKPRGRARFAAHRGPSTISKMAKLAPLNRRSQGPISGEPAARRRARRNRHHDPQRQRGWCSLRRASPAATHGKVGTYSAPANAMTPGTSRAESVRRGVANQHVVLLTGEREWGAQRRSGRGGRLSRSSVRLPTCHQDSPNAIGLFTNRPQGAVRPPPTAGSRRETRISFTPPRSLPRGLSL